MTPHSEALAALLFPPFAARIRTAANSLGSAIYLCIVEGVRSGAEQDADWQKGRDAQGNIIRKRDVVTNAKRGFSMHQYGLAADIVPYLSGSTGPLNWQPETVQYKAMVTALKNANLVWGGDWVSIDDEDHFQMPGLPVTPTVAMRGMYGDGTRNNLPAIWASLSLSSAAKVA